MDLSTYKRTFTEDSTPGWSSIDERLDKFYLGKEPDFHMGTIIKHALGGPDPIDGTSVYKRLEPSSHLHFVSYGMSELYYNEEAAGEEFSKWGFEFTFRLAMAEKEFPSTDDALPVWPINLMQNLARYVFESGNFFEDGHFIPANGPICLDRETAMVALLIVRDPELGHIDTPHGKVDFLQLVGITQDEVDALFEKKITASQLQDALMAGNPLLLTDLNRSVNVLDGL